MMKKKRAVLLILAFFLLLHCLWSQVTDYRIGEGIILYPKLTVSSPKIDGVLDDPAWQNGPIVNGPFIINQPVYG